MRKVSLVILSLFMLAGCATMFTGSYGDVVIRSEPANAKVTVDGLYKGLTPLTVALKRDKDHNIVIQKAGFQDATAKVRRTFNAVSLLNLVSPLCWAADYVTGGIWKFSGSEFDVTLAKASAKSTAAPDTDNATELEQ